MPCHASHGMATVMAIGHRRPTDRPRGQPRDVSGEPPGTSTSGSSLGLDVHIRPSVRSPSPCRARAYGSRGAGVGTVGIGVSLPAPSGRQVAPTYPDAEPDLIQDFKLCLPPSLTTVRRPSVPDHAATPAAQTTVPRPRGSPVYFYTTRWTRLK